MIELRSWLTFACMSCIITALSHSWRFLIILLPIRMETTNTTAAKDPATAVTTAIFLGVPCEALSSEVFIRLPSVWTSERRGWDTSRPDISEEGQTTYAFQRWDAHRHIIVTTWSYDSAPSRLKRKKVSSPLMKFLLLSLLWVIKVLVPVPGPR